MFLAKSIYRLPAHRLPCMLSASKQDKQAKSFCDSSVKDENLYKILGVSSKATQTDIKDAYYNLTLKFHPDRNEGSPQAAVKFHEITEAYEVLGNYFLRRRYDKGMPLPERDETATVPHTVKYQKFFDARNLPYQPSAYAAGGGARKFEDYHAQQFSEHRSRQVIDEEREYDKSCEEKKTPTMVAIFFIVVIIKCLKKDLDFGTGPRVSVEQYNYI